MAQVEPLLSASSGQVLVLSGDVPRLRTETLARLAATQRESGAAAVMVTAMLERPYGYGRIVRAGAGSSVWWRNATSPRDSTRFEK